MKDDRIYLLHIQDATARVVAYTRSGQATFESDTMVQDAVFRNIEVIGEAVKNLSPEFRAAHSDVPWSEIARMRDKLIHQYFRINRPLVWEVVERDIPVLQTTIEALLQASPESSPNLESPAPLPPVPPQP